MPALRGWGHCNDMLRAALCRFLLTVAAGELAMAARGDVWHFGIKANRGQPGNF